ncbi:MAG: GNAT family N-acetyltransferase [Candidatus Acidiferrales bacterium]
MISTLRVALHPAIEPFAPEARYALRTLLRLAGYAQQFVWANSAESSGADIYYGPARPAGSATNPAACSIAWCGKPLTEAASLEPHGLRHQEGLAFFDFGEASSGLHRGGDGQVHFASDIVLASYWLLSGARERHYRRDSRDNFHLDGSPLLSSGGLEQPLVSAYAAFLRRYFAAQGKAPAALPWAGSGGIGAAFAFSHDVDYPEMIRPIEFLRVLSGRTHAPRRTLAGVLSGANHFWRFADWVKLAQRYGARPAFYFSARRGSLTQYAAGTPDCFYDIRSPRFRELFRYLRDAGCEIGLHASYHAFQDAQQLRREKESLEEAAGARVEGGRHHYWRLNPEAPHETLAHHQQMGMAYDSSLAFEFYPGFRRGVCHPFRPFDPRTRRELDIVELPPTWMDDHFDRRLAKNGIADPAAPEAEVAERTSAHARRLLDAVRATGGVAVVDYHVRGMNADFFPRYGPWLTRFAERHFDSALSFATPRDLARQYGEYEHALDACSSDATEQPSVVTHQPIAAREYDRELTVDLLQPQDEPAWEAFVASHAAASVYHTLAWKKITEEGLGHRALYIKASDAAGTIRGVLPLFLVSGLYGRRLVSVPMRDRAGIVAEDSAAAAALLRRAIELTRELQCQYLEIRSLQGIPGDLAGTLGFRRNTDWVTTQIDLAPGRDALWKALDKNAIRWAIGKAERQGLRFVVDDSEAALHLFYALFCRTRHAMGIPVFPRKFFVAMWRHLIRSGGGKLFLVYHQDVPVHAMICFASKATFIPAYAAPQNRWRKQYPSEFMIWNSIRWAVENGFRAYDFGADSFRQEGLLFFKRKWGGLHHRMNYDFFLHRARKLPEFDSSSPFYRGVRKCWSWLPEPLSVSLGGWVTRQLS